MASSVLFASDTRNVFLIDIPLSISRAQATDHHPNTRRLLSTRAPIETPFATTEPKTQQAKENLRERQVDIDQDHERATVDAVTHALAAVQQSHFGTWCLTRHTTTTKPSPTASSESVLTERISRIVKQFTHSTGKSPAMKTPTTSWNLWHAPTYTNTADNSTKVSISLSPSPSSDSEEDILTFNIPPMSTFTLSELPFSTLSSAPVPTTGFPLILLDPPWPNRSASRKGDYKTIRNTSDAAQLLRYLNLDMYISTESRSTVAIWVTNKPRIRSAAIEWLEELGMVVVEEWIWVKVTTSGEPVLPVEGEWRKPYEILLIAGSPQGLAGPGTQVQRRIIAAVPDEHSRKPCLKELFELLLDLPQDYTGLEIFSRNLVAGWHSWGNEVILFNWEGYWTEEDGS